MFLVDEMVYLVLRRAAARGSGAGARHARGTSATSPARAWASSLARPTRSRRSSASRHTFPPTSACRAPPRARRCYRPQSPCRRCAGYPLRPKSGMTGGRRGGRPWAVGGPFNRRCGANERHARCPTVAEERDSSETPGVPTLDRDKAPSSNTMLHYGSNTAYLGVHFYVSRYTQHSYCTAHYLP